VRVEVIRQSSGAPAGSESTAGEGVDAVAALRRLFPALAQAPPDTLGRIVERGVHRNIAAGTVLFDERMPCAGFPLVPAGTVKIFQRYPNGRELQLYRVRPGESCLLSGSCLLGHSNYTASGIAETDVELLVVKPDEFNALIAATWRSERTCSACSASAWRHCCRWWRRSRTRSSTSAWRRCWSRVVVRYGQPTSRSPTSSAASAKSSAGC